jgi:hypothetical protein
MNLIFERGDRDLPAGHALIYFHGDAGVVLATYVSIPPIPFDLAKYVPPVMQAALENLPFAGGNMVAAIPPSPEEVESVEYLHSLAERRHDDLIYAGGTSNLRMMEDAQEAAGQYGEIYRESAIPEPAEARSPTDLDQSGFAEMSEREQLDELTNLTGRLRDSLQTGAADPDLEKQMRTLAALLPAKYRAMALVDAALIPGEQGQKLAALHLERCYKLYHEEYQDLERIDREIAAIGD